MKYNNEDLFKQAINVSKHRYITHLNNACSDCDPKKTTSVKSRIKTEIDCEFQARENDPRIGAIRCLLPFFEEQIDQFSSRNYDENLKNAKDEFIKYYSCRERNFENDKGLLFSWSDERIICELGAYKGWHELSKLPLDFSTHDYIDATFDEEVPLFPTTPPNIKKSKLIIRIEKEIELENNEVEKSLVNNKKKFDFTGFPHYRLLTRIREIFINQISVISEIDEYEFLKIFYDRPSDKLINWNNSIEELAFVIIYFHEKLALAPTFFGSRKKSVNYEKWVKIFTIDNRPINQGYLKGIVCGVKRENKEYKKLNKMNPKYNNILGAINTAEIVQRNT